MNRGSPEQRTARYKFLEFHAGPDYPPDIQKELEPYVNEWGEKWLAWRSWVPLVDHESRIII